ncbi:hypothetical protein BHE90_004117 [Fusarium euwallaceae]|uniref:Uncharacterized protein n=2 Tax=Fusarium solani species complex TaxID=232080 RepID=A0A430M055_9HYPO|nr:hypothetical protein CEP51_007998 [Fusarium floridanum]RTE81329.1 hypothetical protein BHE90_004117 [Fusarium euwallaceae]
MTTNADHTFTPHPSPEEIQDEWNVSLYGLEDECENQAVVAHLRSIWKENWWKYPDNIKRSFLSATRKTATTKTNNQRPTAHVLFRGSVRFNRLDFDWGVWLVLRAIYYDVNKRAVNPRARMTRSNFSRGPAKEMIMQRYPGVNVLEANVPPTFPPRPPSWDKVSGDGTGDSSTSPKVEMGAASASNQTSTGEDGGIQNSGADYNAETADDGSDSSPSPNDVTSKGKEVAKKHTSAPSQDGNSHLHANLDLTLPSFEAAFSTVGPTLDSLIQSTNQVQASLDALLQGPANEGDHHSEKAADTSNDSNGRPEGPKGISKSLPKRRLSDDEEEDSPCSEHTQKRQCTSSDQSSPAESDATTSSGLQKAIVDMDLDQIYELLKKTLNKKTAELATKHVTRQAESLQPPLKDQIAQSLSEKIFRILNISEPSIITNKVIDSMAEQMTSKIIQKVAQKVTQELTAEQQPEVDKRIVDCVARIMMGKLFGPNGIPGL